MKHPLAFLLRFGRSAADRASLQGDLDEESRARIAGGRGRLSTFVWQTGQILGAGAYAIRDAVPRRFGILSWPDLKLSFRLLFKYPGLTIVAGIGIAVGIAISAGSFAFLYSMVYPTIPLDEGDRIVALENWNVAKDNEDRFAIHDFVTWREQMTTVVDVGAFGQYDFRLQFGTRLPETVRVAAMTASGFALARVPPLKGRFLTPGDERPDADAVLVIGYDAWRSRFAMDASIVGQQVRLGRTIHTIVGVMPDGFKFPVNHQFWVPYRASPLAFERGTGPQMFVFGRLAPGATMASAQTELAAIGQRTASAFPKTHANLKPHVIPYTRSINDIQDADLEFWMLMMQGMMSLVLVAVALNVAILVYARTAHRRREIAIRTALGAGRLRIVAQLFGEALVLAFVPALAGLALAQYALQTGLDILAREGLFGGAAPFWTDYGVQPATVIYILSLVILTAGVVGILPALQATRRNVAGDIRQLGGTGVRLGRSWGLLIVAQVAIAVAVLPATVGMGLREMRSAFIGPAYPDQEFFSVTVGTETASTRLGSRLSELERLVQSEPDVAGVTFLGTLPRREGTRIEFAGQGDPVIVVAENLQARGVGHNFLKLYDSRPLAGRAFGARDASDTSNPVIVDRTFVRNVLNGEPAVGRRFRYAAAAPDAEPSAWFEIVGVTENLRTDPLDSGLLQPFMFYPVAAEQLSVAAVRVRVRGPATSRLESGLATRLHQIAAGIDADLRLGEIRAGGGSGQEGLVIRLVATAVTLVIVTVLLLSAAGVYSLMSFTVAQRRREIGIRTALGAPRHRVLQSIFWRVALQVGVGVVAGIAGAVALESASGALSQSGARTIVIAAIALIMLLVGFFAAFGPVRRGLRIQPTEALRAE